MATCVVSLVCLSKSDVEAIVMERRRRRKDGRTEGREDGRKVRKKTLREEGRGGGRVVSQLKWL